MNVFDECERTDKRPARYGESTFSFLNRSAQPAFERIRKEIERWFAQYPGSAQEHLRSRLRTEFNSASFELLLHELFRRLGASLALHPDIGSKGRNPDFLVTPQEGKPFVLEATLCMDEAEDEAAERRRLGTLYDAINDMESPCFHLIVRNITENAAKQIPARRVIAFLERELSKLDPESVFADYQQHQEYPRRSFQDGDSLIELDILPKLREAWGRNTSRTIGSTGVRSRWGGAENSLRKTLFAKAKRYGEINRPFVIGVNCLSDWGIDKEEERAALFGTIEEYVPAGSDQLAVRQLANGFWGSETHPKSTRVSGVILGVALPWNIPRCRLSVYRNPWATHPLPEFNSPFEQAVWHNGHVRYASATVSMATVFRVPEDWPGVLFEQYDDAD